MIRSVRNTLRFLGFALVITAALFGSARTASAQGVTITPASGNFVDIVGSQGTFQLTATGGTSPYTYAVISGTLPTGVTLSTSGLFAGSPTTVGIFTYTIRATSANNLTGTVTYVEQIFPTITVTAASSLTGLTVGRSITGVAAFTATGGSGGPYNFVVTVGALPAGLSLGANGALVGTPTTAGAYSFTVTTTDNAGNAVTTAYTGTVAAAAPTMPQWALLMLAMGLIALAVRSMSTRVAAR